MPDILAQIRQRARQRQARIVLPESGDERVVEAAERAARDGLCRPWLVADRQELRERLGRDPACELVSLTEAPDPASLEAHLGRRLEARRQGGETAREVLGDPLVLACALVATGQADGAVMGAEATTAQTLRAALLAVGPRPGLRLVSSYFLMSFPDGRNLIYTDCGVVPDPSPRGLADIAEAAAASCRLLLQEEPRVALLSFSTRGSAEHAKVEKVRKAVAELGQRDVDFAFDGELQGDAALVPEVARRKAPDSPVAGSANVLVFPDLDAGNIAYKLSERLTGGRAIGPLLQGLQGPIHDLSRGCSAEDVEDVMAVAALGAC